MGSCTTPNFNNNSKMEFLVYVDSALIQHLAENNGIKADFIVDSILGRYYLEDKGTILPIPNNWKGGEVKTAEEAYRIAEPYFLEIYRNDIELRKPLHINLIKDSLWIVYGYPQPTDSILCFGSDMYMEIKKDNGTISKVVLGE